MPPPPTSTATLSPHDIPLPASAERNKQPLADPRFVVPEYAEHPGGQSNLKLGRDSPRADLFFLCYHLGCDIDGKISAIAKKKNVHTPTGGAVFEDIHQALLRIKKEKAIHGTIYRVWCFIVTVLMSIVFPLFLWHPTPQLSIVIGFLWVTYSFNIFHMRHHKGGNLYRNKFLDGITAPYYSFLERTYTIDPVSWIANHQGSHHLYTNNDELDHDVWQPFPFLRLHPKQEFKSFHKYQSFYAPLLFCGTTLSFPFDGLLIHGTGVPTFATYILTVWALPFYNAGWQGVGCIFVMYCITGTMMSYLFQISHNHKGLGGRNQIVTNFDSWAKLQIEESVSWGGYLSGLIFGGINYQTEHHIAPALDPTLYHFLYPELVKIAKKHGIKYTYEPSFYGALSQYHGWLSKMGEGKVE